MKILITNLQLDDRTGTEIVVRDLDAGLRARGHEVCVYTPRPGELAAEIRAAGGTVVDDLDQVPFMPEVIHGHQTVETATALAHFPTVPGIYVCHDRHHPDDAPLRAAAVRRYVSVDRNCDERVRLEAGIPAELTRIVHNAVDLGRFRPRSSLPGRPRRAVVFSNYAVHGGYVDQVRAACAARRISLDVIGGGVGTSVRRPEEVLGGYDIVIGKGRCVLEALAVGCAAIVADAGGLGSMVTSDAVAELRDWNFGGRCLQRPLTAATIGAEIDRYDARDAARTSTWIREMAGLDRALDAYEAIYAEAVADGVADADATTWIGLFGDQVARAGLLERVARASSVLLGAALSPPAAARIVVDALTTPGIAAPGTVVPVVVSIRNGSAETLHSLGDAPVHASYRLLSVAGAPLPIEGERTVFDGPLTAGGQRTMTVRVRVPDEPGRYVVALDLVQEGRFWFREIDGFRASDLPIVVAADASRSAGWTLSQLALLEPVDVARDAPFTTLGFATASGDGVLSFAETAGFLDRALRSGRPAALVVPPDLVDLVPDDVGVVVADRPRATFARLHRALAERTEIYRSPQPTVIDPSARIHPSAVIAEMGVEIGADVVIGPNVTLIGPVRCAPGAEVMAGSTIGSAGFQTVALDGARVEMVHAGGVAIGPGAVVFAGAVVARGLFGTDTVLGAHTRIGNGAFVSHDCRIGDRASVGHGAIVSGNVVVGPDVWIGPGSTVSNNLTIGARARITIGSTVISDVPDDGRVSGLPAVGHAAALRAAAAMRRTT